MKKIHILALWLTGTLGMTSCLGDLDVQPLDPNVITAEKAYTDSESYLKGLMKIYSIWALHSQEGKSGTCDISGIDGGNSQILRSLFNLQEISTDEAKNVWPNAWCDAINGLKWGDEKNESVEGVYQFGMYIISLSNEYLKNIGNAADDIKGRYAAEARFNRALAYYVLMDVFGYPPFITENNYSNAPKQVSREELFNYIETELKELRGDLPNARQGEYGRADQGAANALLARMYLNAKTYTGKERYSDCIEACKLVIGGGYELASSYRNLFRADNGQNADTKQEIIFPICFDGTKTESWGGMAYIICSARASSNDDPTAGFTVSGWGGLVTTQNLLLQFDYADPANPTSDNILDKRGVFSSKGRKTMNLVDPKGNFVEQSWAVYKYSNITSTDQPAPNSVNGEDPDTDFLMFRLADIYLMYAEAVARSGRGGDDMDKAIGYVNLLRKRGYGNDTHQVSEAWLKDNDYRNILNERSRELYWEGVRRTDLIRYGLFTSGTYLWPYKGGVIEGVGVSEKYKLYAIPTSDISVNPNLNQNDGFK